MEPNNGASSSARAQELRESLGARRDVEVLLAEATAARQSAMADADALVAEAQQLSEELLQESRTEAERLRSEASELAESIIGEANAEAADLAGRALREAEELTTRTQSEAEELMARTAAEAEELTDRTRAEADDVARQARAEAEDVTRQARTAADEVRARAEADVEDYRRRVRAEVTEQVTHEVNEQSRRELALMHERQQSMIGDLEASVRILGVSLESSVANIGEMLSALDGLRAHTAESLGESGPGDVPPAVASEPVDEVPPAVVSEPALPPRPTSPVDDLFRVTADLEEEQTEPRPGAGTSSIFDNPGPTASVPTPSPVFDAGAGVPPGDLPDEVEDLDEVDDLDEDPPLTATEAFLRSSHIDHGDPPFPSADDDADVGERYARDAMRSTARSRTRQDEETLEVLPERAGAGREGRDERERGDHRDSEDSGERGEHEDSETAGKPLGWLFRSSS